MLLYLLLRVPLLRLYHLDGGDLALGCEIMLFVAVYSLISIAVVRPILTVLLVYTFGLDLHGAWIALTVDQTTRAVCSMLGVRRVFPVRAKS